MKKAAAALTPVQRAIGLALLAAGMVGLAHSQDAYPNKPIQVVVPFPAGGANDTLTRLVGQKLSESWKVPVIVENRPGGNTIIAAQSVARAAPDGYTLLTVMDGTLAMNPSLYEKLPYDPVKDFALITQAVSVPMVIAIHPGFKAEDLKALIAAAKSKPGGVSYAWAALPAQVAGALFQSMAKVDMLAVPYKGSAPAQQDVMGGFVPVLFDAVGSSAGLIRGGKLKALAVTSVQRSSALPDVPTVAEAGVPGYGIVSWTGFAAPAGIPKDRLAKLNAEIVRILNLPEVRGRLADLGMEVVANSPEQFNEVVRADTVRLGKIIKAAGIRVE